MNMTITMTTDEELMLNLGWLAGELSREEHWAHLVEMMANPQPGNDRVAGYLTELRDQLTQLLQESKVEESEPPEFSRSKEEAAIVRASLKLNPIQHRGAWLYVVDVLRDSPKGRTANYVRKLRNQMIALLHESGIEPDLSDERIIEIRDALLPSQGEPFDCIAFARAVLKARAAG